MYEKLEIFRMAHAMATHAGSRQAVTARNIANADTPGYKAQDVAPFSEYYQDQHRADSLRATRAGHLKADAPTELSSPQSSDAYGYESPNGNSVSIELEMMRSIETQKQHDRALAIYKSSLGILRTSLGRR